MDYQSSHCSSCSGLSTFPHWSVDRLYTSPGSSGFNQLRLNTCEHWQVMSRINSNFIPNVSFILFLLCMSQTQWDGHFLKPLIQLIQQKSKYLPSTSHVWIESPTAGFLQHFHNYIINQLSDTTWEGMLNIITSVMWTSSEPLYNISAVTVCLALTQVV